MSADPSQLISEILRNIEHGRNPQVLSISGPTNQTLQLNQGPLSSGGPNVSQTFQVANSNIVNILSIGNPNLGASAIVNRTADQADLNAKLAAVKESTVEVGKSTAKLKGSAVKVAETTAKLSEWITALDWPTLKLGLVSEIDITLGNRTFEHCMSILKLGLSFLEFAQSSIEHGESTVRDSDSILNTKVGESISPVAFDTLTSKLGEVAGRFRESRTRFIESYINSGAHSDPTRLIETASTLKGSRLGEFMEAADFDTFRGVFVELKESNLMTGTSLVAFSESMVAYARSLGAPDDLIAAFSRQNR